MKDKAPLWNQQLQQIIHEGCIETIRFSEMNQAKTGKVRDLYFPSSSTMLMVTSDRVSAFDRHLTTIPLKGIILNLLKT